MTDKPPIDEQSILSARIAALANMLSRLLAYEAKRHPNPDQFLTEFPAATESDLQKVAKVEHLDALAITVLDVIQNEVDEVVGQARQLIRGSPT